MTSWAELSAKLPGSANMADPKWQAWIVSKWANGDYPALEWFPVVTRHGDFKATFTVSTQLRLGDAYDSVLPIVSAVTAQTAADMSHNAVLPTALLMDHIADQGELISYVDDVYADVADLSAAQMVENSRRIDTVRRGRGAEVGLWTVGKTSVPHAWYNNPAAAGLRNGANTMINYGAHTTNAVGAAGGNPWRSVSLPSVLRVWQPPGGRGKLYHDLIHVDISQKAPNLVMRSVHVQGPGVDEQMDIGVVAASAQLWPLVSSAGPMDSVRIPIEVVTGQAPPPPPRGGGLPTTPVSNGGASARGPSRAALGVVALGLTAAVVWYAMS